MKNIIIITTLSLLALAGQGQISVSCIQDTTLSGFMSDYDPLDLQPTVTGATDVMISYDSYSFSFGCEVNYCRKDSIVWSIEADGTPYSCVSLITIPMVSINELIMPDSVVNIPIGSLPVPASVGINQNITGICNISSTYNDVIIYTILGFKVVRTWTFIDWCTEDIIEHVMIINIAEASQNIIFGANWYNVNGVAATYPGMTYNPDLSECPSAIGSNYPDLQYVYCAEVNPISTTPTLYSDQNYLNGVSTLDLVLIQRHILGLSSFNESWKFIAADANADGNVTAFDLVSLRKIILGIWNILPNNHSVLGVPNNNTTNPYPFNYEEYTLVKIGDVNNSAVPGLQNEVQVDTRSTTVLQTSDMVLTKGISYLVPISLSNKQNLLGLQSTLQFDPNKIQINNIIPGTLAIDEESVNKHLSDQGLISLLWMSPTALTSKSDKPLFYLELTTKETTLLSESLRFGSAITENILVTDDFIEYSPTLSFLSLEHMEVKLYPNPSHEILNIESYTDDLLTLILMNSQGQVIINKHIQGSEKIDVSTLAEGIYFYKISNNGSYTQQNKLIIQH